MRRFSYVKKKSFVIMVQRLPADAPGGRRGWYRVIPLAGPEINPRVDALVAGRPDPGSTGTGG
jgi:hypothetical protein